jgi:hypothetical protein
MCHHPHGDCLECRATSARYAELRAWADERAAVNIALRTRYNRLRKAAEEAHRYFRNRPGNWEYQTLQMLEAALAEEGE